MGYSEARAVDSVDSPELRPPQAAKRSRPRGPAKSVRMFMGSREPSIIRRLGCARDRGKEVLGRWLQSQLALQEIVGWESGSSSHMGVFCIILGYDCHCSNVTRLLLT